MPRRPPRRVLNVLDEITSTPPPTLEPSQCIARIASAQGRDCFRVTLPSTYTPALEVADPKNVLVELASEFRGKTWMRRGGYVLVDLAKRGKKIEGEIVNVVREEKEWRAMPYWPEEFRKDNVVEDEDSEEEESTVGKMPPSDSESE